MNTGKNYLGFIPRVEKTCWDLLRFAHSRADLTLVTSPQMKEELEANGIPRVDVWRKGIDTERFHPSFYRREMRELMTDGHPEDFLMVYVGRLGAEKRLKDIKAMLRRMPNARLCIVGTGPQKEELEEYFAGEKAVFTGQLSGDDLSAAFASADVFVMPSDSETVSFVSVVCCVWYRYFRDNPRKTQLTDTFLLKPSITVGLCRVGEHGVGSSRGGSSGRWYPRPHRRREHGVLGTPR